MNSNGLSATSSRASDPRPAVVVPSWPPGDTIPLGRGRGLPVLEKRRRSQPDNTPVLVVEED
jgi:hypothetical protein